MLSFTCRRRVYKQVDIFQALLTQRLYKGDQKSCTQSPEYSWQIWHSWSKASALEPAQALAKSRHNLQIFAALPCNCTHKQLINFLHGVRLVVWIAACCTQDSWSNQLTTYNSCKSRTLWRVLGGISRRQDSQIWSYFPFLRLVFQ